MALEVRSGQTPVLAAAMAGRFLKRSLAGLAAALLALAQQATAPDIPTAPFRAEVRLVEVDASVFDKRGNPMSNLTRERFQVMDNGQPQEITAFEGSDDKVSCALVMDVTGSMEKFLPSLKIAASRFVDELRDKEEVGIYTFTTSLSLAQPFTSDKKLLKQAILRTRAGGDTALFDSVSNVTRDLEARHGKKAIVLFTDGADNSSTLNAAGASRRARLLGVPIYSIAEGAALNDRDLLKTLEQLAADSGGRLFRLGNVNKISEVFSAIVQNLKPAYLLAWKLPDNAGQVWRPLTITVKGEQDARIRARQGYYPQ
jgi:Ca-activated chloride channel family protein